MRRLIPKVAGLCLVICWCLPAAAQSATPVASSNGTPSACPTTTVEHNIDLVLRWFAPWESGNLDAYDGLVSPNFVYHWGQGPDTSDLAAFKRRVAEFRTAFPDLQWTGDEIFGSGDSVAARWTATGTHKGAFRNIAPTGKKVTWTGINVFHISCGRITEAWNETDDVGLLQQLGVMPPVGTPGAS